MQKAASYILSAYSFIHTESIENLLNVGYKLEGGIPIPSFDEDLLINLCCESQQIFSKENNVLSINGDITIVGDIHGSFHDLLRIIKFAQRNNSKVLFLGDFVDRGEFSLECITLLFALKVIHPDTFYLIRGNHEFDSLCSRYGFKNEILGIQKSHSLDLPLDSNDQEQIDSLNEHYENYNNKYCYKYTEKLYNTFIRVFSYLPIAALVNKTTFCIHGGLSPKLDHIDSINNYIQRPIFDFESNTLLSDLVWSDPSYGSKCLFDENPRGRGYLFNSESILNFLRNNSISRIVRAHQCVAGSFQVCVGKKCITIFSSSSYDNSTNPSAVMQLFQKNDTFKITTFSPLKRIKKIEAFYYKVQPLGITDKKRHSCVSLLHPTIRPSGSVRIFTNINLNHNSDNLLLRRCSHTKSSLSKSKFITNRAKTEFVPLIPILYNDENESFNEIMNTNEAP